MEDWPLNQLKNLEIQHQMKMLLEQLKSLKDLPAAVTSLQETMASFEANMDLEQTNEYLETLNGLITTIDGVIDTTSTTLNNTYTKVANIETLATSIKNALSPNTYIARKVYADRLVILDIGFWATMIKFEVVTSATGLAYVLYNLEAIIPVASRTGLITDPENHVGESLNPSYLSYASITWTSSGQQAGTYGATMNCFNSPGTTAIFLPIRYFAFQTTDSNLIEMVIRAWKGY